MCASHRCKQKIIIVATLFLSCLLLATKAWAVGGAVTGRSRTQSSQKDNSGDAATGGKSPLFMTVDEAEQSSCGAEAISRSATPDEAAAVATRAKESSLSRKPRKGDVVTIDILKFRPVGDFVPEPVFDTAGTVSFVMHGGGYLPGLHELLDSMQPGDISRGATLDAGYGAWNPDMSMEVSKADVDIGDVKVGMKLSLENGLECVVTKVTEDNFTIDANSPLAGASYTVDVELVAVEEGPTEFGYVPHGTGAKYEVATFGLGCFWGGELAYQRNPGVVGTRVGYTQGQKDNPTYEEVCAGTTGHTEAIQIIYDPTVASYESLVELAFDRLGEDIYRLHQVGNDKGTQYRHGVYFHNDEQKRTAGKLFGRYGEGVVTELKAAEVFYVAEEYHQQYLLKGGQSAKKGAADAIRCYG